MDQSTHTPMQTHAYHNPQGNHYQYDSLRRAKHSSMMCLYHLLNPEAPKFLPACVLCLKDITSAYKWACLERGCEDEFAICNVSSSRSSQGLHCMHCVHCIGRHTGTPRHAHSLIYSFKHEHKQTQKNRTATTRAGGGPTRTTGWRRRPSAPSSRTGAAPTTRTCCGTRSESRHVT